MTSQGLRAPVEEGVEVASAPKANLKETAALVETACAVYSNAVPSLVITPPMRDAV